MGTRGEVDKKCVMALYDAGEGSRTTSPELSKPYGRGLESVMAVGQVSAVGWTIGVYAQFSGILIGCIRIDLGNRGEAPTNQQGSV